MVWCFERVCGEVGRCCRVARPITRTSVLVVRRCVAKSGVAVVCARSLADDVYQLS